MQENLPFSNEFHTVIVASGHGQRMGVHTPKQFLRIAGRSVLEHSVQAFAAHPQCTSVIVVVAKAYLEEAHDLFMGHEKVSVCVGGDTRKHSSYNGLKALLNILDEDIVLIHDAARPCVSRTDIDALLEVMADARAASLAIPSSGTLAKAGDDDLIHEYINRDQVYSLQTPQAFQYGDILKAHQRFADEDFSDDTQLMRKMGIDVRLVEGHANNIKITYETDLELASMILNSQKTVRSGMGFDVHAFDYDRTGPVRLCGVDVDHAHPLKGHSDADVGFHALTDAIYGALGAGDIGFHFPPSDDAYKDMDSAVFLEKAITLMRERGGVLNNADVTLICEAPKISPHAGEMKERIAEICGVHSDIINVKATTTEQLGFTGRKEGIAAQAIVSIML